MALSNLFQTVVNGVTEYEGNNLESAISAWTHKSFDLTKSGERPTGHVSIQTWDEYGYMVRIGNLISVYPNGHVFVSRSWNV